MTGRLPGTGLAVVLAALASACGDDQSYVGVPEPTCASAACAPVLLASQQDNPIAIAVHGGDVYWLDYGSGIGTGALMSLPATGGDPVTLASGLTRPVALAVDDEAVFWAESGLEPHDGRVTKLPLTGGMPAVGGTPVVLAAGLLFPSWIGTSGGIVYFREEASGRIAFVPSAGGEVTILATGEPGAGAATLGPEGVYWMVTGEAHFGGEVRVVAFSGGTSQDRGGGFQAGTSIAVDEKGGVYQGWDLVGGAIGRVWPVADDGSAEVLAYDQPLPRSLIASGGRLLWSDYSADGEHGSIMMLDGEELAGPIASPSSIAVRQPGPGAIAVSGGRVYWVNRGTVGVNESRSDVGLVAHGSVMAAALPTP